MTYLVQMSGVPGSGKSTTARELGRRIPAVVFDHDVTKSLLIETGMSHREAGMLSYRLIQQWTKQLLDQGFSVVIDSPCHYEQLLAVGQRIAAETGSLYRYVECLVDDIDELDRRLRGRSPLPSQFVDVWNGPVGRAPDESGKSGPEMFREWVRKNKRPRAGHFEVDTSRPLDECVSEIMRYIRND